MHMQIWKRGPAPKPPPPRPKARVVPNPDGAQCSATNCTNCVAQFWDVGVGLSDGARRWVRPPKAMRRRATVDSMLMNPHRSDHNYRRLI